MAGMRGFALRHTGSSAYLAAAVGDACHTSQMAIAKPTVVPLWKVIVGPQPTNSSRTRKGPAFLVMADCSRRSPHWSERVRPKAGPMINSAEMRERPSRISPPLNPGYGF
jgi:hypothetical protein